MDESATGADDALVGDVSIARKLLDEPLAVQQVDLPDFFGDMRSLLRREGSEADEYANQDS